MESFSILLKHVTVKMLVINISANIKKMTETRGGLQLTVVYKVHSK